MTAASTRAFQDDYLATWTEPDPEARRRRIEKVWAPDGHLVVSSLGATVEGVDAITAHIAHVHDDLIAGKGLVFRYDQQVEAPGSVLLRWSMLAPTGTVVGRGADIVFRDDAGRAQTVHMFMGVD
jgi:hypothetical protein